jgi:NADPH-dependent curcumin reductase CurA
MTISKEWRLIRHPEGQPADDDVALVAVDVPEPGSGEVLIRNVAMSVDPYMRGRMAKGESYTKHYELDQPMTGRAIGQVVASHDPDLPESSWVLHDAGWREYAVIPTGNASVIDTALTDPTAYLGVLGSTGFTAWIGLFDVAGLRRGESVFVSSAAGAVGVTVGQLAKARGATVIGSAGSPAKVAALVDEFGFDAAFDYHDGPLRDSLPAALRQAGQDGVDVFFDNVGGEQLEAGLQVMNVFGRIVLCGAIAAYTTTTPACGPRNPLLMIWRRLRMEGFLLTDHEHKRPEFLAEMTRLVADGTVRSVETVTAGGIEQAWHAFLCLLDGSNVGKAIVSLQSSGRST